MDHVMKVLSAAEQGDVPAMNSFLEQGRGGVCDDEGASPLLYAAANGKDSVLRILLQNNEDVNSRNLYAWTPLLQAACYGHLPCVMLLLQNRADVTATNKWGVSALVGAAQGGFLTIVQVLLREGAEVNRNNEVTCLTPLMAATQCGHEDVAAQLIESGAEVNARLRTTRWTALMLAALNNHLHVVKLLLKHGASKEACDINGKTAGDLATALGHKSIACLLSGEKPKTFTEVDLFVAVKAGNLDQINEILDQDRGLACAQDKDGATPLMFAANKGHMEICEVLLSAEADVNVQDSVHGWTALMQATHQKQHQVAKLLGARGADVDIRGKSGSTAFDIANMIGDIEMIRIIANTTMERIQNRGPGMTTNDLAPSSKATPPIPSTGVAKPKPIEETDSPLVEERGGAAGPEAIKEEAPAVIGIAELTRRMQNAHKSPTTPVLSIPESETNSLNLDPLSSRFPRNRIRSNPRLSSSPTSSLGIPDFGSSGSSTASEPPPSFQVGDTPQPKTPRGDKSLLSPVSHKGTLAKFLSKSGPPAPGGGASTGSRPPSLQLKQANKNPLISPQNSSRFAVQKSPSSSRELPSLLQKYAGSHSRDPRPRLPILTTSKVKERGPTSPYRRSSQTGLFGEVGSPSYGPGRMRDRCSTDPARCRPSWGRMTKTPLPKTLEQPSGPDLQTLLEGESLGHCHALFAAQEVDYHSFVTLTARDLEELGFTGSEERARLLRLISRLNSRMPGAKTPGSATPHRKETPPHRSQTFPVFVFQ